VARSPLSSAHFLRDDEAAVDSVPGCRMQGQALP
jgi:hypothetical protein